MRNAWGKTIGAVLLAAVIAVSSVGCGAGDPPAESESAWSEGIQSETETAAGNGTESTAETAFATETENGAADSGEDAVAGTEATSSTAGKEITDTSSDNEATGSVTGTETTDSVNKSAAAGESAVGAGAGDTTAGTKQATSSATSKADTNAGTSDKKDSKKSVASKSKTDTLAAPSNSGALQVIGTQLCDESGNAVQLRGISTHGLAWFPDYVNNALFKQFREEWNVNVIRLAMYTDEYGGYCSGGNQDDLKKLMKNGVKYATDNDMYVIIDWHMLNDQNPNTYIDEAKAFFREMSKEYASSDNVLYEICNEPNGGTTWNDIKAYANEIIPIIRKNDKDAIIIVGTPNWSQYVDQAADDPITGYDNIMYALHFYAATHKESLRNTMTAAIDKGLPVFVSEYGICDASGSGGIDETEANKWVSTMDSYGVSYVAWNLSNKDETSAILKASCSKTSGITESDLSDSGKWLYKMLTGGKSESGNSKKQSSDTTGDTSVSTAADTPGSAGADASDSTVIDNPSSAVDNQSSTAADNSGSAGTGTQNTTTDSTQTASTTLTNKNLNIDASVSNSWESDGATCYQYTVSIKNTTGKTSNKWKIKIKFNEDIILRNGWNGQMTVDGSTLTIESADYNGTIEPDGSVTDIGFIISGSQSLTIKK
jgi:endoglucanase